MPFFQIKWAAILAIALFLLGGCDNKEPEEALFLPALQEESESEEQKVDAPKTEETPLWAVHICGAVVNPGVYTLPAGSRVMDVVSIAGGFTPEAARDARNLAEPVVDGSRIYIPAKEELTDSVLEWDAKEDSAQSPPLSEDQKDKVNINTADMAALMTLPGIGESRATAILAYRQENGPFGKVEDIMKVSGIKEAAFGKIKDKIIV